jgi:hypothetical protein
MSLLQTNVMTSTEWGGGEIAVRMATGHGAGRPKNEVGFPAGARDSSLLRKSPNQLRGSPSLLVCFIGDEQARA